MFESLVKNPSSTAAARLTPFSITRLLPQKAVPGLVWGPRRPQLIPLPPLPHLAPGPPTRTVPSRGLRPHPRACTGAQGTHSTHPPPTENHPPQHVTAPAAPERRGPAPAPPPPRPRAAGIKALVLGISARRNSLSRRLRFQLQPARPAGPDAGSTPVTSRVRSATSVVTSIVPPLPRNPSLGNVVAISLQPTSVTPTPVTTGPHL